MRPLSGVLTPPQDVSIGRCGHLTPPLCLLFHHFRTWQKDHKLSVVFMFYCRLYQFVCYVTASSCIVISCSPCRINRFRWPLKRPERRHLRVLCFKGSSILLCLSEGATFYFDTGAPFLFALVRKSSILLCLSEGAPFYFALEGAPFCFDSEGAPFYSSLSEKAPFFFASGRRSSSLFCLGHKELDSTLSLSEGASFYFDSCYQKESHSTLTFYSPEKGTVNLWLCTP